MSTVLSSRRVAAVAAEGGTCLMPWFNVDDGFTFHRKALIAGNTAIGLWTRAGSWCSHQLTEGFVPTDMVTKIGTLKQAQRLVAAGLWHEVEGGYQFHEWSEEGRNPTREQVLERRRREREKKAKARAVKQEGGKKSENEQVDEACPQGTPEGHPPGSTGGIPEGVRATTPLHSPPKKEEKKTSSSSSAKRGSRIPDDFTVTPDMVAWARERCSHVDGRTETEKFINYWQAKSGKDATKLDWVATWRNWMLNAAERAPSRASPTVHPTDAAIARLVGNGSQPTLIALPGGEK